MAIVAGTTKLRIDNGLGGFLEWTVRSRIANTTTNQSTFAAGALVDLQLTRTQGTGTGNPSDPNTLYLRVLRSDGVALYSTTYPGGMTTLTDWFYGTSNGDTTGTPRAGTLEIVLRAERTSVGTYDVESDGSPNTPPTGFTMTSDRGWVRFTTNATQAVSNVAQAGAKNQPFEFGETIYVRTTLAHPPFTTGAATLSLTPKLVQAGNTKRSGTASSSTDVFDIAFSGTSLTSGRVNRGLDPGALLYTTAVDVPSGTLPGGTSTGASWTLFDTVTTDSATIDPTITVNHHLQHNDGVYAVAKDVDPKNRLTSDLSFIGFSLTGARGGTLNGLSATEKLTDTANLLGGPFVNRSVSTGADGAPTATPKLATWDKGLPAGEWTHEVTVSTSDATNLEAATRTDPYTLLAVNPSFVTIVAGGPVTTAAHFGPGKGMQAGLSIIDVATGKRVPLLSAKVAIFRLADAALGAVAGFAQYLNSAGVWVAMDDPPGDTDTDAAFFHDCAQSRPGSGLYLKTWADADTAGWGTYDAFVVGRAVDATGTPYTNYVQVGSVGAINGHDAYKADPAPFLGLPGKK